MKELAGTLNSPNERDFVRPKHVLRYGTGASHCKLHPKRDLNLRPNAQNTFTITTLVDAELGWLRGCQDIYQWILIQILNACVRHCGKTQSVPAQSSAGSEL